jgi:hypothetical protein
MVVMVMTPVFSSPPPRTPIIVPVIPAWGIFPVRFFDVCSHADLKRGDSRQRGINITPRDCSEDAEAQKGHE